ncbi:serine/threonine protein phosphatase, partial [Streptomyces sp. BR123]|nr:serine/threonine protein phosphatase [Streptomyces sp. BR123]
MRTETLRDFRVPVTEPHPYGVPARLPEEAPVYGEYPAYYGEPAPAPGAVPP